MRLESGDLLIDGILQHAPLAYQIVNGSRHSVKARFRLMPHGTATEVAFTLGKYDHGAELIIDPVITYEKQIPGEVAAMAVDAQGNVYLTGSTRPANPLVNRPQVLVAKLTPDGSDFAYLTYLGGSGFSFASAIALDSSGNAWVGGYTNAPNFPNTVQLSKRNLSPPLLLPTQVVLLSTMPPSTSSPPQPVPAEVLYAGSAPGEVAGVVQINFLIPADLSAPPISTSYGNILVALVIGSEDGYGTSGGIFVQP